jgi:CubicO group peptidase (beta-lactamase class C family)
VRTPLLPVAFDMMKCWIAIAVLAATACATGPLVLSSPEAASAGVAFDRDAERDSFAEGLADPASGRRVTVNDPVRIASVSKLVVAIGVMRLVEQGKLDLDSDVSRWLGWQLRNPAFPDRAISLRQLLSHTASVRDHDDQYAIPLGGSLRDVMTDATSWDSKNAPGAGYFAYSNMNFPIIASVMERATGQRFDLLMKQLVIAPLRIDACFNWPTCSDSAVARAVVLTQDGKPVRDDHGGKRPPCPVFVRDTEPCDLGRWKLGDNGALFAPQGGLRISARDLARIGRLLLGRGTIDGVQILTPASVDSMLAPIWRYDGRNGSQAGESEGICSYGLAVQQLAGDTAGCSDGSSRDEQGWVGHSGSAYGLRSGLWIDPSRRVGIAYFATDVPASNSNSWPPSFARTARLLDGR